DPIDMTQRGSAIWSYTLRNAGAILLHSVPATIITSDCRGLGRNTTPKRSRSYRAAPACIISTAQHASPNVIGHIEPLRAQLMTLSSVVVTKPFSSTPSIAISSLPLQSTFLPFVDEPDDQNQQEHHHRRKAEKADVRQHDR